MDKPSLTVCLSSMSYDLLERNQTISNMTPRLNAQLNTLPNLGTCRFCEAGLRHTFVDLGMSPELTNQIVEFIQQGCDQKTACNLAGVAYSYYNEWKEKGSEGKEPYATFLSVISYATSHRLPETSPSWATMHYTEKIKPMLPVAST
jgi:hypothetical protein